MFELVLIMAAIMSAFAICATALEKVFDRLIPADEEGADYGKEY